MGLQNAGFDPKLPEFLWPDPARPDPKNWANGLTRPGPTRGGPLIPDPTRPAGQNILTRSTPI